MTPTTSAVNPIKPLFNLDLGQPFLLRPLHQIEIDLVNEWVNFYNDLPEE